MLADAADPAKAPNCNATDSVWWQQHVARSSLHTDAVTTRISSAVVAFVCYCYFCFAVRSNSRATQLHATNLQHSGSTALAQ